MSETNEAIYFNLLIFGLLRLLKKSRNDEWVWIAFGKAIAMTEKYNKWSAIRHKYGESAKFLAKLRF